ncbi:MAG TPA: S24 family peptidase, partial [Deinococcales bacterium]|nr:S24 family peptidase [Deinococcales bacterium]
MKLPRVQQELWDSIIRHVRTEGQIPPPHILRDERGCAHSTLSEALQALEAKGLLTFQGRGRGRTPFLRLTSKGQLMAGLRGLPVVGAIPAGRLADAVQDPIAFLNVPTKPGWFALRVAGDSMAEVILDGDLVVLQPEAQPRPNEICAVRVGNDQATLKYLRWHEDRAELVPHNPAYPTVQVPLAEVQID